MNKINNKMENHKVGETITGEKIPNEVIEFYNVLFEGCKDYAEGFVMTHSEDFELDEIADRVENGLLQDADILGWLGGFWLDARGQMYLRGFDEYEYEVLASAVYQSVYENIMTICGRK